MLIFGELGVTPVPFRQTPGQPESVTLIFETDAQGI